MAKAKTEAVVYQLKISLDNSEPAIWRRVQVKDCTLAEMHAIIQRSMGWENSHMHSFQVGKEVFGDAELDDALNESKLKLSGIVAAKRKKFSYTYDFGDGWDHTISIEKKLDVEEGVKYPRCIAGERACPPEDCGGVWGYARTLQILADPKHAEYEDIREWIGEDFDAEKFSPEDIFKHWK